MRVDICPHLGAFVLENTPSSAADQLGNEGAALVITADTGDAPIVAAPHFEIPVGCVGRFIINVYVDGKPAIVQSSQWTLGGETIEWESAEQSRQKTIVPTVQKHAMVTGDPASIRAGWVGPVDGVISITVTGDAKSGHSKFRYEAKATVTLQVPTYDIEQPSFGASEIEVFEAELDEDLKQGINFGFFPDGLSCGITRTDALGGELGLLQVMNQHQVLREALNGAKPEVKGIQPDRTPALDDSGAGFFYDDEDITSFEDGPFEPLYVGEEKFTSYSREDEFTIYIAFRAPTGGAIVASYYVACDAAEWGWGAEAVYGNGDKWSIAKSEKHSNEKFKRSKWKPVTWNSNNDDPAINIWRKLS